MNISINDNRTYHSLTLTNGLKVLLVQDLETEKSAASITVNAGHFDDPSDRQGLAHFLEHMLFLGTDEFPEPGAFTQFTNQHGGNANAWTGTEHSSYFFEIENTFFSDALTQFSRFFIAPLISSDTTEKERNAIDAEFKLKLKDDTRRIYQVHKETANPKHPFAKFSVGNKDTLADINGCINTEIKAFFDKHYHAAAMTLCICSPFSIEQQSEWVNQLFLQVAKSPTEKQAIAEPLYYPEHLKKLILIEPHKHMQKLVISFALPNIDIYYRQKTVSFIAHIIGYEGHGSLYAILKDKGWINGLTAGGGINGSNFKDFNISINLTDEGIIHYKEIVVNLFQFLPLLTQNLAKLPPLYEDKKALLQIAFDNQEKSRVIDFVNGLSISMQHYPEDDYLQGDYVMDGFDEVQFKQIFTLLNPQNMRLVLLHPEVETTQQTAWYHTPYAQHDIEPAWLEELSNISEPDKEMSLPLPNIYLKKPIQLLPVEEYSDIPKQISTTRGLDFWFQQDHSYRVSKGHFYVALDSKYSVKNIENMALSRLLADLFMDKVAQEFYSAELAGLSYHLSSHQGGLTLHTSGLSANQYDLVSGLLNALFNCEFCENRFFEYKKLLTRHWLNSHHNKPVGQLFGILSAQVLPWNPTAEDLAQALEQVNFKQFNLFRKTLLSELHVQALLHGNWQHKDAQLFYTLLNEQLRNVTPIADLIRPISPIDTIENRIESLAHPDHASIIYFQAQTDDIKEKVSFMCLNHLISQDYFQKMRTEKQLGYLVGTGYAPLNNRAGIAFYIQSPHTQAEELISQSQHFFSSYAQEIAAMTKEQWDRTKQGLLVQIKEKDKNLRLRSQRYWLSLNNQDTSFQMQTKLADTLHQLSHQEIIEFTSLTFEKNRVRLELGTTALSQA